MVGTGRHRRAMSVSSYQRESERWSRWKLLALPTKAAPVVHQRKTIAETCEAIRLHVYKVLTELSTTPIEEMLGGATDE